MQHPSSYGLILAISAACVFLLMGASAKRFRLKKGTVPLFSALAVVLGLAMARIVFCLTCYGYYVIEISQPEMMLHLWDGGYSLMGAGVGVCLAALIAAKLTKERAGNLMDCLAVFAGLFLIGERLAESFTALGLGRGVQTPWLQKLPFFTVLDESNFLVHPVYRYEATAALAILAAMLALAFLGKQAGKPGDLALIFGSLYGSCQVVLESMRNDGHMLWGFVRANQIFSIFLPVAAILVFTARLIKIRGVTWHSIVIWAGAAVCIAVGVVKEFDVDSSENLWLDYGVMALCMAALAILGLAALRLSRRARGQSITG